MNSFDKLNIITILIIGIFLLPLFTGLLHPISNSRIQHSLLSILKSINLILGLLLAAHFVKTIFSNKQNSFLVLIYKLIPSAEIVIKRYSDDIIAHLISMFLLLVIILWFLEILTIPLYKYVIVPLAERLSSIFNPKSSKVKRLLSAAWHLPKSICMVLFFALLLNFYSTFVNNPITNEYINDSNVYQIINRNILNPILDTNIVKNMPILFNDSFKKTAKNLTPANNVNGKTSNYWNTTVIKYFNGITLDEAIKSNSNIDNTAKQIVKNKKDDIIKAYLLYKWISHNIEYDNAKAQIIVKNPSYVNSGSIVTFAERKGICFDYSCLYISMCRAVGLKVRFVTGLAYNGSEWGDHAWNQVYSTQEQRWINVDTTFGSSGHSFFDNRNFDTNHKYEVVQGEW